LVFFELFCGFLYGQTGEHRIVSLAPRAELELAGIPEALDFPEGVLDLLLLFG